MSRLATIPSSDLIDGLRIDADVLRGYGVGSIACFEAAAARALASLLELEARGTSTKSVDYWLAFLVDAERAGWHCRVLPDPEVMRRGLALDHPNHPDRCAP